MIFRFIGAGLLFLNILFVCQAYAGEYNSASLEPGRRDRFNIILIDITSLRADHLSCYGYFRQTSPFIDNLAHEGVWFTQAVSHAYWTLPSVASVLTSKYVTSHHVDSRDRKLNDSEATLAEILKKYGFKTAAFVGGLDLDSVHNLNQGFDIYSDETLDKPMGSLVEIFPRALNWLSDNKNTNFFMFVQGYDVHPPLHYPAAFENKFDPDYQGIINSMQLDYAFLKKISHNELFLDDKKIALSKADIGHIIAHYDGGVAYVDSLLEKFISRLQELNLINKTIIFVFADHGEELADRGYFKRFENANLYEEVVHVPLIIKHPNIKRIRIGQQVQLIDIAPTVLSFLRLPQEKSMMGKDLFAVIKDEAAPDLDEYAYSGWGKKQMVRGLGHKLIFNDGNFELYDLKNDPKESRNIINQNQEISSRLAMKLFDWYITTRAPGRLGQVNLPEDEMPEFFRKVQQQKRKSWRHSQRSIQE